LTAKAKDTLGLVARINIAAFVAYLINSWVNVYIYDKLKKKFEGKRGVHLWLRAVVSTGLAMILDSLIFSFGSFAGVLPSSVIWGMIFANCVVKCSTSLVEVFWLQPLIDLKKKQLAADGIDPASLLSE